MTMREFKKQNGKTIRFSTEVPEIGSIYRSNGPLPYIPSYSKISLTGVLVLPAVIVKQTKTEPGYEQTPERAYNYEICHNRITIDGYYVCDAPDNHSDGKKYTVAQKLKFCKAVIWQLMYDEGSLRDQIALLGTGPINRVIRSVPDKVPEVIAVSAPIVPVYPKTGEVDPCPVLSIEEMTGYPAVEIIEPITDEYDELLKNGMFDHGPSMLDNEIDTGFMDEIEKESIGEMFAAFNPVIIRQWNHGTLKITEEVYA